MAASRSRGFLPLISSVTRRRLNKTRTVQARSRHGEPWEDSVEVDRDPNVLRRFGRVLGEHKICKAAPEWLPFVPGSCYWLPPEELTVLPSEAFGYIRDLSDNEVRDVVKRLRLKSPVTEVVVVVDGPDVDEHLEDIVKSVWNKQGS